MRNLCPQECPDWLYYEYFPQAHTIDLEDFWPPETIVTTMEATGFARVTVELEHLGLRRICASGSMRCDDEIRTPN
jgi:hypothetical protein